MAKQTFTAGQVLTATQMNNLQANDYNWTTSAQTSSYVLVAANAGQTVTMTNAGATTITVNTGLFAAGDRVNILNLGAGNCTITAGTATVNSAGSLVLPQYGSGTLWFSSTSAAIFIPDDRNSGLAIVQPETALSAAATLTLDGCFTSSYTNYRLHLNVTGASVASPLLQLRASGATAATNYNRQYVDASSTVMSAARATSQTSVDIGYMESDFRTTFIVEIFQPQLAQFTNFYCQNIYTSGANTTNVVWYQISALHSAATAYDGFIITFGANATGTYSLYGYGK